MNKSDIIRGLAARTDLTNTEVEEVINGFLDVVGLSLSCGEDVKLSGFGKFECRDRNPVTRMNPKTGDPIDVPAKRGIGFVASPILKSRVNENYTTS